MKTILHRAKRLPVLAFALLTAVEPTFAYTVQRGDNLSSIAHANFQGRVFGANGSLKKILKLNPQIENPDLLLIGTVLSLPTETARIPANAEASAVAISQAQVATQPEPKPLPTPASAPTEVRKEDRSFGSLGLQPGFQFSRIDARDKSNSMAIFLSEVSPSLGLFWKQDFSASFQTSLRVQYAQFNFQTPVNRELVNSKINRFGGSFDLIAALGSSPVSLIGGAGFSEEIQVQSVGPQRLRFSKVSVPNAKVGMKLAVLNTNPFTISVSGGAMYLARARNADYRLQGGSRFFTQAELMQKLKHGALAASVFYETSKQKSPELGDFKHQDLGLNVSYEWSLQ